MNESAAQNEIDYGTALERASDDPVDDSEVELNRMISNIGFGKFHRRILGLCGLGWLADNMFMQCVACILPRVQQHFSVSNGQIGLMSSSMFLGLTGGALMWGLLSDRFGRLVAYHWTLVVSAVFAMLASFAPSFGVFCACLFGLGTGVGGNMPVDGAIFLEFIPREKRHLLTLLSVFFSFGSVLTSVLALAILPPFSCPDDSQGCDVGKLNNGWRYLMATLSLVTMAMVVLRNGWFSLYESPKFLLQQNRRSDVIIVLKKIVMFNGGTTKAVGTSPRSGDHSDGQDVADFESSLISPQINQSSDDIARPPSLSSSDDMSWLEWPEDIEEPGRPASRPQAKSIQSRIRGALDFRSHMRSLEPLFTPELRRTTVLIWLIWSLVAMGFTMFNVFLPKFLESRSAPGAQQQQQLTAGSHSKQTAVYRDALIYAVSGIPGSILGAWMVDTRLGRIYSMAISTFFAGLALITFAMTAKTHVAWLTTMSSSVFGLTSSLMYAIIYAYTPEVFHPSVRGTACGIASAMGRVAGIIAPLVAGMLLEVSTTLPMYLSVALLWMSAASMVALPIETRDIAT